MPTNAPLHNPESRRIMSSKRYNCTDILIKI
jgi:hypothetical protein